MYTRSWSILFFFFFFSSFLAFKDSATCEAYHHGTRSLDIIILIAFFHLPLPLLRCILSLSHLKMQEGPLHYHRSQQNTGIDSRIPLGRTSHMSTSAVTVARMTRTPCVPSNRHIITENLPMLQIGTGEALWHFARNDQRQPPDHPLS